MLETHDLLPVSWQLAVPNVVSARLVDMGAVCNRAALTVEQAYLQQRHAAAEIDAAVSTETGGYRAVFARHWFDTAVSYTDQLTAVYTVAAATFVAYAAMIAAVYAAWGTFPLTEPARMLPSRLLGEPATHLPLVQMPAVSRRPVMDHNNELAASHKVLMHVVDVTVRSHPLDVYDIPSRVACRPAMSIDLGVDLASRMHAYAANCAWALGLATRQDHGPR